MIRVRTKNNRPRFFRGGIEFGRGWLTLTEPGDPGDAIDLTEDQAAAIRAETRFLEVEEISAEDAARIVSPTSSGSSGWDVDPAAQAAGESPEHSSGEAIDPSSAAPGADGKATELVTRSNDPAGPGAQPDGEGPVNVNTASAFAIAAAAHGIGKATASDLVKHRKVKGPFASLDDLTQVGGIGKATVKRNRDRLTV